MANRMKDNIPVTIGDFSGGEADLPFTKMPPKFSVNMTNMYPTATGGAAFIPGYLRVNQYAVPEVLTNGHVFIKADGTKIVLCAGGGKVYKVVGNTLTSIITGWDTTARVRFITANNYCIIKNGVNTPQKYDGTTVSALGGSPPATAFKGVYHRGRVWLLERTNKLLASYSALYAIEDYTTAHNAGYFDFTKILKSGDELTDIESYMDLLVFYFKNHIIVYSGSNPTDYGDFQIVFQVEGAGAVTDTLKACGLDHYFLSQIGARSLRQVMQTGAEAEDLISKNIQPRLVAAYSGNPSGPYASAHFQRLGFYMALIGDEIWIYVYNRGGWCRITGAHIYGMFSDSDGSAVYLCGQGFLYKYDEGFSHDGVAMRREWHPAWLKFFKNSEQVSPKVLEIYSTTPVPVMFQVGQRFDLNAGVPDSVQSFSLNPTPVLMDEAVPDIWDVCFLMDPEDYIPTRIPLYGRGSTMQFCFATEDPNGPCEINGLKILFVPGGD